MDYSICPGISYYKTIAVINESHNIFLVQHQATKKIYVKKVLDIYNFSIYAYLRQNKITGIPQVIDIQEENNQLIVIEEFISGISLQEIMVTGQLSAVSLVRYICDLCDILDHLHSLPTPIIHRDIKPSNIIITPYDHAVLIDFNAAKYLTNINTSDTILLGTKGYAAPEQYGFGSSTPQTDIYALGVLLKELTSTLPAPTDKFTSIINRCIQINPSDRFVSVKDLKEKLQGEKETFKNSKSDFFTWKLLIPPGYRTLTPWKIVVSTTIYLFIFWLSLTMEFQGIYGPVLWMERIFTLLIFLSIICCTFNYCNVQHFWPLCKSKNPILHYIGVLLLNVLIIFLLITILVIIESILVS